MVKNLPANAGDAGDAGSILGLGRRKWQLPPVFLPGNPMDRGAWQATESDTTERLSTEVPQSRHHLPVTLKNAALCILMREYK